MNEIASARPFFFDRSMLERLAAAERNAYVEARPFPHAVLDGLIDEQFLDGVLAEIEAIPLQEWQVMRGGAERKLVIRDEARLGPLTRHLFAELKSSAFVRFLEMLTGIGGLIPNVHLESGGGVFQSEPGCMMPVHVDYNRNEQLGLERRANVLLYLNKDWRDEDGAYLELWNADASRCEKRIVPLFNRCVVFAGSDRTFHGHPTPVGCAPGGTRKSIAVYYLTSGRPADEWSPSHPTLFQRTPAERARVVARDLVRGLTPPLVAAAARRLVRAVRR